MAEESVESIHFQELRFGPAEEWYGEIDLLGKFIWFFSAPPCLRGEHGI
jgi:hypothetical protein